MKSPELSKIEKNVQQSPEEIAESEKMIREDRKNELRKLACNHGLKQATYYLINRQFEKQITLHPPKYISEKLFYNKPEIYPKVLMINEPVDWKESQTNLTSRPYTAPLFHAGVFEDDFWIRYHFNQIQSLHKPESITMFSVGNDQEDEASEKICVPTSIYGAFRYVINKERNINFTREEYSSVKPPRFVF
jgi:hypothetical protein